MRNPNDANGSENCTRCKFYRERGLARKTHADEPDRMIGNCRRYPPTFLTETALDYQVTGYPAVDETYWCGEFKT